MDKKENLMPIEVVNSSRTREKHSQDSRKAGIVSGEVRRRNRDMKELLIMLGSVPVRKGAGADLEAVSSLAELKGVNLTAEEAMALSIVNKCINGDLKAIEFYRDTTGQKPDTRFNVNGCIPVVIAGEDEIPD